MAAEPEANFERPRCGPSDRLASMFKACSKDPAEVIQTRLTCMLNVFLQHCRDSAQNEKANELADECCHQAGVSYYEILEKLAIQESNRLGISDMWSFFNNGLQQKCLVACCLEINMSSKNLPCEFPRLLQIFNLAPYPFVIQAAEHLPDAVRKHLTQVMEKILESLAWTNDSPLWEEIKANGDRLPTYQQVMPPNRLEDPTRADVQPGSNLLGVPANPDQQPSTPAESRPQKSKSLTFFVRKVYTLSDKRLNAQFLTRGISDEQQGKIWTCFEHSLVNFPNLMKDRHLDQLLMCAIFIVDKVCNDVLISGGSTEDSLAGNNNNEENSSAFPTPDTPSAHYPVPREQQRGNNPQDLVYFLNQVYSPKMSDFASQLAAPAGVSSPPLTPYPKATRRRMFNNSNIYFSPYEKGMTHQHTSRLTYIFNSSPSECLRQMNSMVAGGRNPSKRSCVALPMEAEEEEDGDDGPPPLRRLRSDSQPALLRRLMDVTKDRAAGRDQV